MNQSTFDIRGANRQICSSINHYSFLFWACSLSCPNCIDCCISANRTIYTVKNIVSIFDFIFKRPTDKIKTILRRSRECCNRITSKRCRGTLGELTAIQFIRHLELFAFQIDFVNISFFLNKSYRNIDIKIRHVKNAASVIGSRSSSTANTR